MVLKDRRERVRLPTRMCQVSLVRLVKISSDTQQFSSQHLY